MYKKIRKCLALLLIGAMMFSCISCGKSEAGNTEDSQGETQNTPVTEKETENEVKVEIVDANDILTKVWATYEDVDSDGNKYNDKFAVMGGHFESAVMDQPAKYDLTKTNDLQLMYCVPASAIAMIDDAATVVHLMRASTFTAGAYHVTDVANVKSVVDGMKQQILANQWLGGFPDEYLIVVLDEQYVISAIGTAEVIDNFEAVIMDIYGKQAVVQVNENIR